MAQHLQLMGCESLRLNIDRFPHDHAFTLDTGAHAGSFSLVMGKQRINSGQIQAVWLRKLLLRGEAEGVAPEYSAMVANENIEIAEGLLQLLATKPSLDAYPHIQRCENKLWQWQVAAQCGLVLPRSIITNELKTAKGFMAADKKAKYITKLLKPLGWSMVGDSPFLYTSFINSNQLRAGTLQVQPTIVQQFIPKQYELRIAYVAGACFAGKIEVAEFEADWRKPGHSGQWQPYTLPAALVKLLQRLMKQLNLQFGAIDIIRGTDGQYYFLEVNPLGEWGMLEKFLGLPVSAAIAAHLAKISIKT